MDHMTIANDTKCFVKKLPYYGEKLIIRVGDKLKKTRGDGLQIGGRLWIESRNHNIINFDLVLIIEVVDCGSRIHYETRSITHMVTIPEKLPFTIPKQWWAIQKLLYDEMYVKFDIETILKRQEMRLAKYRKQKNEQSKKWLRDFYEEVYSKHHMKDWSEVGDGDILKDSDLISDVNNIINDEGW
jgi:hypothetical protein